MKTSPEYNLVALVQQKNQLTQIVYGGQKDNLLCSFGTFSLQFDKKKVFTLNAFCKQINNS